MWNEFVLLSMAHLFAVASPGADFAVVLKNTLQSGRRNGVFCAIGVGCGISIHLIYTLFGVALILSQSEYWFFIIKVIGALYLVWLAYQLFQSRAKKVVHHPPLKRKAISQFKAFQQGFLTNVFNPKVTLFFLVLFTNIVDVKTPLIWQSLYGAWLVFYTIVWFCLVAWFFSRPKILHSYQAHGYYFDWLMGGFLLLLAAKLLLN
jgi:RhtB (resistance to homoserine/threonine) family protein